MVVYVSKIRSLKKEFFLCDMFWNWKKNTEYSFGIDRNLFYYIGYSMPFMI